MEDLTAENFWFFLNKNDLPRTKKYIVSSLIVLRSTTSVTGVKVI